MLSIVETPHGTIQIGNVHLRPPLNENGGAGLFTMWTTSKIRKLELMCLLGY